MIFHRGTRKWPIMEDRGAARFTRFSIGNWRQGQSQPFRAWKHRARALRARKGRNRRQVPRASNRHVHSLIGFLIRRCGAGPSRRSKRHNKFVEERFRAWSRNASKPKLKLKAHRGARRRFKITAKGNHQARALLRQAALDGHQGSCRMPAQEADAVVQQSRRRQHQADASVRIRLFFL